MTPPTLWGRDDLPPVGAIVYEPDRGPDAPRYTVTGHGCGHPHAKDCPHRATAVTVAYLGRGYCVDARWLEVDSCPSASA